MNDKTIVATLKRKFIETHIIGFGERVVPSQLLRAELSSRSGRGGGLASLDESFPINRKPSLWRAWAPVVHSVSGFLSIGFGGLIALHYRWIGAAMMIVGALMVWYSISGRSGRLDG